MTGLWLVVALGLISVFLVEEWTYYGPSITQRIKTWWRRRQLKKRADNLHRLQCLYNPRSEAMRTFTKS